MSRLFVVALALAILGAPACAQQPPGQPPAPPGQITCSEPRPRVCTREYRPVCAMRRDGTRQTFGNACSACADAGVVTHIPGPCS